MRKKILKSIVFVLIVLVIALSLWINGSYSPSDRALKFGVSTEVVNITEDKYGINFKPIFEAKASGVIFYPGGKVEPEAYNPLAYALAEQGYLTTVVKMPLNLAVLDADGGKKIIQRHPKVKYWYIGGHSLGGAMAGNFASDYSDIIEGVYFLGAYPVKDLTELDIDVLLINGSLDGIINQKKLSDGATLIPKDSKNIIIPGGNHSQFGSYGLQKKDNKARITRKEQQSKTVHLIIEMIENRQ